MNGPEVISSAREAETVFNVASTLETAQRTAYLDRACEGNAALRGRVEALLQSHDQLGGFLPDDPKNMAAVDLTQAIGETPGEIIGRYKLLEKIGEGGSGAVYLAEQETPVRRQVALKILKLGLDTKQVVARFEAERQSLAMMDHPNISRVLDGGSTDRGRPYFVMELVRGVRITEHCEAHRLATNERLALFIEVCQAVQHAHQKGIIHRDLKPSNILVGMQDGRTVPKVIDFGVAKAIEGGPTEHTALTGFAQMIGTPAYMSPEQTGATSRDIDTRSDIYSLGVLLYELLTGTTPFDPQELLKSGFDEMRRTIREVEPPTPSCRVGQLSELRVERVERVERDQQRSATWGRTFNSQLKLLSTDLDWIVMRCLEKDRNRRYETAEALAADLQRHLRSEPVLARPPSNLYRFRKMVLRNKGAVVLTSLIVLTLLAGIAATSWQAIRARRAERQQALERARAEKRLAATMRFFDQAFSSVSPALADVIGAARPRELLAGAAAAVLDDLRQGDPPDEKARAVLGQLYQQLALSHGWFTGNTTGDYDAAWNAVTNAIAFRESVAGAFPKDSSLMNLSYSEQAAGLICLGLLKYPEAIEHYQKCHQWATRLRQQSTNSYYLAQSISLQESASGNIGGVLVRTGRGEEAITNIFLPALDRLRERGNLDQSPNIWALWDVKSANHALGMAYCRLERYPDGLPYLREALRAMELIHQRNAHSAQFGSALAVVRATLGEALLCLHQPAEGLPLLEAATELADELTRRDPANAGFTQVQIEVCWRNAAGRAAWARDPSASLVDRWARLSEGQTHLDRAHALLAGLKSKSLRKFLGADLEPVTAKVAQTRLLLESKGGPR